MGCGKGIALYSNCDHVHVQVWNAWSMREPLIYNGKVTKLAFVQLIDICIYSDSTFMAFIMQKILWNRSNNLGIFCVLHI